MASPLDSAHAPAADGQTGADVIVDYLIREKVPYVFGLCGHGNIGFIDSLYARGEAIKTVSVHHETVCGFMADVFYRVSGQPCATFTSCGPGSANMPIALANAFFDSVPFLAVTGNVPTTQFNRGAFQETYRHFQADFPSTVRAYCKRVYQPTRPEQVTIATRQAWKTMVTGRSAASSMSSAWARPSGSAPQRQRMFAFHASGSGVPSVHGSLKMSNGTSSTTGPGRPVTIVFHARRVCSATCSGRVGWNTRLQ